MYFKQLKNDDNFETTSLYNFLKIINYKFNAMQSRLINATFCPDFYSEC